MSEEIQYRIFRLVAEYQTLLACDRVFRRFSFFDESRRCVDRMVTIRHSIDGLVEMLQSDLR